jgi:hypothetical protein
MCDITKVQIAVNETYIEWKDLKVKLGTEKSLKSKLGILSNELLDEGIAETILDIQMKHRSYLNQLKRLTKLVEDELI